MGASTLVGNIRIQVNPRLHGIEFCHLWQFELIFEVDQSRVLFIGLEEPFGGKFATMGDSGHNAFELDNIKVTSSFYFPTKPPLLMSSSRLPVKMYLKLREEAINSAVTRGSSYQVPKIFVAAQYE